MMGWFNDLSNAEKIAIVVPVGLAVIGGLFVLCKGLFRKKNDPDLALKIIDNTLQETEQLRQTVKQLEEQLAQPSLEANSASGQSTPLPSAQAIELAGLITEDDGLYAQSLKAIAEGDNEKADALLDETQQFLDTLQQQKDECAKQSWCEQAGQSSLAKG